MIIAPTHIEPARLEDVPEAIADLANELTLQSSQLGRNLPDRTLQDLAAMVRLMNSYYSNRIEGHTTRPRDIERALAGDFDDDPARRALQREAAAHVCLQAVIDERAAAGTLEDPSEGEFIKWLHREFYRDAAPDMLIISDKITMVPGVWRDGDVDVGLHVPPPHDRVPAFIDHFHQRFRQDRMGRAGRVLAVASAHHRLNYIHPFFDGNGRVTRLVCHAMAHHAGIAAGGLWSVSRGLARGLAGGLAGREEYKSMMQLADRERQGDRDGRGNLSLAALVIFTDWFLKVCLDQVWFMGEMFDLDSLDGRYERYVRLRDMRREAPRLLKLILNRGEIARGDVGPMIGTAPRTANRVVDELVKEGLIASEKPKGPLSLRFPSHTHDELFPRLFEQGV